MNYKKTEANGRFKALSLRFPGRELAALGLNPSALVSESTLVIAILLYFSFYFRRSVRCCELFCLISWGSFADYISQDFFFLFNFLFCIAVEPINNVVTVSGEQPRDWAIHLCVSILPQTPLASRLPHNTEQSSLCCTVGPRWLSILNIAVSTCPSQTP